MEKLYESAVIELETLSPLFIKGKSLDYGEGMLKGTDSKGKECVYLIDNDKLCDYIAEKGKVEEYVEYFVRDDKISNFKNFIDFTGIVHQIDWMQCKPNSKNKYCDVEMSYEGKNYEINIKNFKYYIKSKRSLPSPKDYDNFINFSLQYFLTYYNIMPTSHEEFTKVAKGVTNIPEDGWNRKTFVKNPADKPFIPGSSIKGAVRNAVLWKIMSESSKKVWLDSFVKTNIKAAKSPEDKKKLKDNFSTDYQFNDKTLSQQSFTEHTPKHSRWGVACLDLQEYRNLLLDCPDSTKILESIKEESDNNVYIDLNQIESKKIKQKIKGVLKKINKKVIETNEVLRDFFRIVKVSDANFISQVFPEQSKVNAVCINNKDQTYRKEFSLNLECVPEFSKARFRITIDLKMAEMFFDKNIPDYLKSISNLLQTVHDFYKNVCNFENSFFYGKEPFSKPDIKVDTDAVSQYYYDLIVNTGKYKQKGKFIFRTGWGGGMMSKSQFINIDKNLRKDVRNLISSRNETAPKSRCLIVEEDKAVSPLGWCSLKILDNNDLPDIRKAGFQTGYSDSSKVSGFPEIHKNQLAVSSKKHKEDSVKKCLYNVGDKIQNSQWKQEGKNFKVKIKKQEQWAELTGKNKPNLYQQRINIIVKEIEKGVVTKVKL